MSKMLIIRTEKVSSYNDKRRISINVDFLFLAPIECASCSLNSDPNKLIENQFLLELSNNEDSGTTKSADFKCSSCSDDAIAVSFCVDCSEYICDSCVQAHQR